MRRPCLHSFRLKILRSLFLWLAGPCSLLAHDPGLSTLNVWLNRNAIEVELVLSTRDATALEALDADGDGRRTATEFARGEHELSEEGALRLEISLDGQRVLLQPITSLFGADDNVIARLRASATSWARLRIRSGLLESLPIGHRQFLKVRSSDGTVLAERLLSAGCDSVVIEGAGTQARTPVRPGATLLGDFLRLGLKHILKGYDHLLFLFSLLAVSRSCASTVKIITCFTVAHSVTLALATFDVIQAPARVVEPLIAASIVFVAVENLVRGDVSKSRMPLVFVFGLVHGLGFATVLRELGTGSAAGGVVMPLLSFNVGVELGQLLVAALLIPAFRAACTHPVLSNRWIPVSSVAVALVGFYWLIQRVCFT